MLKDKLFDKKECGWKDLNEEEKKAAFELSDRYIDFLNRSKTEREFVKSAKAIGLKSANFFCKITPIGKIIEFAKINIAPTPVLPNFKSPMVV